MCCSETNQMQQLEEVIKKYKSTQGALIPVLHEAQDIFGYLPPEVMKRVAKGQISRQCLSGYCLLCQRRGGHFG